MKHTLKDKTEYIVRGNPPCSRPKYHRAYLDEAVRAAIRTSAYHNRTIYIIPTYYGHTLTWEKGHTSIVPYLEVTAAYSSVYNVTLSEYHLA